MWKQSNDWKHNIRQALQGLKIGQHKTAQLKTGPSLLFPPYLGKSIVSLSAATAYVQRTDSTNAQINGVVPEEIT